MSNSSHYQIKNVLVDEYLTSNGKGLILALRQFSCSLKEYPFLFVANESAFRRVLLEMCQLSEGFWRKEVIVGTLKSS